MNTTISARILLGGRVVGYSGRYPGLMEEAWLAVRDDLPLYLIGGFGGCTRSIIDAIEGRQPAELTFDGQLKLDETLRQQNPAQAKTPYGERVADFNRRASKNAGVDPINYDTLLNCLTTHGVAGLSRHNGLTPDQNRRLFTTPHVAEMIYLVLRGLNGLQSQGVLRLK